MPTAPSKSKQKHGKDYLDEAVAKSIYRYKPISRKRALYAAVLGFPFGWAGIHNFVMRRKKRGALHVIISTVALSLFFYPFSYGISVVYRCKLGIECIDMSAYDDTLNALIIAGLVLCVANLLWGIIESIIILINLNRFPTTVSKDQD